MKAIPVRSSYIANLPMLLSMSAAAVWVWYFNATAESAALFLGIIAGGLVDLDDRLTGRLRNIFFTVVHFSLASISVQLTYGHAVPFLLLMVMAAFLVTLAGAIDVRYRTIAFGTLLVMLYTVLTHMPDTAWYVNPLMLVCGTLLYSAFTLAVHLIFPHRPAQESVADAYRKLAGYMRTKARFFDPDEADYLDEKEIRLALDNTAVIQAFNQCRSALFYRLRSQHRHPRTIRMLQFYFAAQNIHERISSRHVEYRDFARKMAHSDLIYRIQRIIVLQADACQAVADALHQDDDCTADAMLERAGNGLKRALRLYCDAHPDDSDIPYLQQLTGNVLAISAQIRRLPEIDDSGTVGDNEHNRIAGQDVDHVRDILPTLRSHLTFESSVFRHAVRLAILTAVSCLIVETFRLPLGYWILLTGLIVCQPNYSATTARLKQRILGTLLGVVVGSTVPYFAPTLAGKLLIVVAGSTLFFVFRTRRYSFSTFFITIQVLAGFSILGMDTPAAMLSRFTDTLFGSALAWCAVSYLWPDWHYLTLGKTARGALLGNAGYLKQIIRQIRHGHADDVTYRTARRVAHERATALGNTVSDMSIEPKKYAARLPDAFSLLQLNYALISSISALGALRGQMHHSGRHMPDEAFMAPFVRLTEDTADLMGRAPETVGADTFAVLRQRVAALAPNDDAPVSEHVLWSQLQRITDKLETYFRLLASPAVLSDSAGKTKPPL